MIIDRLSIALTDSAILIDNNSAQMIYLFIYLLFHFYLSQDTKRMKTDIPYRNDKTVLDRSSPSKVCQFSSKLCLLIIKTIVRIN